ncbi:cytochrome c4 [Dechloromonas denitrificans]|uniref:c-type cytochrome n=1 Tax=Dechloromonas denitrificans TaxID=281362 RepID=UPI001CF85212|nr:c-type cytochrome [Dechloromonas denitrificans]UCV10250.1 cytochrome c4 [Dechloromonas denitrificans]
MGNKKTLLLCAGVLLTALNAPVFADAKADQARAAEIVSGRCFLCHGLEGESASAVFPRLAGQHSEYIAKQLGDFKSGKRKSDTMKPQADELTPEEMKSLGTFFEAKTAKPRQGKDAELLAVGKFIFTRGNQFSGLPSCASCHGAKGYGTPLLPRLAGQHPRYIEDQLKQFNKRERTNDNAVMHTIASKLSELETHAVAEYIATLD